MGIPFNQSFPKIIITNQANTYRSLDGATIDKGKMTFMAKIISLGRRTLNILTEYLAYIT